MIYQENPVPGDWEHKGLECDSHGPNVPFARPKGSVQKHECVACLLEVAEILKRQEKK